MRRPSQKSASALVFAICLTCLPFPGQADTVGLDLSRFLPGDSLRWNAEETSEDGAQHFKDLRWRGPAFDLGAQSLALTPQEDGSVKVQANGLVLRSRVENGPVVSVSSLDIVLDGVIDKDASALTACDILPAMSSLRIKDLFVEFAEIPGKLFAKFDLQDVYFDRKAQDGACALRGIAGTGLSEIQFSDGSDILLTKSVFQMSGPVTADGIVEGGKAALRAALTGVEYRGLGEVPAFGLPEASFALDVAEPSLAAPIQLLSSTSFWAPQEGSDLDVMKFWNAITDLDGRLLGKAPVLRLYTPGVVPEAMVANFSRAGLSTLSGAGEIDLSFSDRLVDIDASIGFTGLFDAKLTASTVALPYPQEKLEAGLKGVDLGFHLIPDLRFGSVEISYVDQGLDKASNDILGVPAGRQVEELAANMRRQGETGASQSLAQVMDGLSMFLRTASEGSEVSVLAGTSEPLSIISIIHLMLADPLALWSKANLSMVKKIQE